MSDPVDSGTPALDPLDLVPFPPFVLPSPGGDQPDPFGPGPFPPFVLPALAATLVEAVEAVAQELVASGQLAWFGAGMAPAGTLVPFGSFADSDESTAWDTVGARSVSGDITAQIFAPSKVDARRLGEALASALDRAWAAGGLASTTEGNPCWWYRGSRSSAEDPDPGDDGLPVWIETRLFNFQLTV